MRRFQKTSLVSFLCLFFGISSCSNPAASEEDGYRPVLPPNYILSKYSLNNQHILSCREGVSEVKILNNLARGLSTEGRHSYFLFELGLCQYVFGERDLASLYMLRAANYSNSYDLRDSAKLLALEFLAVSSISRSDIPNSLYDVLWANEILEALDQQSDPYYVEFSGEYKLTNHSIGAAYAAEKIEQMNR